MAKVLVSILEVHQWRWNMTKKQHHSHTATSSCYLNKIGNSYFPFVVIHNIQVYLIIIDDLLCQKLYLGLRIKKPHSFLDQEQKLFLR